MYFERRLRRIPLRLAVTGTRGKSTVTRLIAGALRASGRSVLAKTTGSAPFLVLPDGTEREIPRRGSPSILEAKGVVNLASGLGAEALVTELMSIDPECLSVESTRMFRPQTLVVTNVRVDHMAQMGSTRASAARSLASAILPGATVFIPQDELLPAFAETARNLGANIIPVETDSLSDPRDEWRPPWLFESTTRLALAVVTSLGVDEKTAVEGMHRARLDLGATRVWVVERGSPRRRFLLIHAFAANDPESTRRVVTRLRATLDTGSLEWMGLLSLRRDRADRSLQWLHALEGGDFPEIRRIFVLGEHGRALRSRLTRALQENIVVLDAAEPESILETIEASHPEGAVIVGMGNIGGVGRLLVEHWERIGVPHEP